MDQYEVAQFLRELALLIELTDTHPKKNIAYRRAATSIEKVNDFDALLKNNSLDSLSGVGKSISKIIISLVNENHLNYYDKLKKTVPHSLLELVHIGLNGEKIRQLYENFKILSINDLEKALDQKIIKGFKPYFLEKLKKRLQRYLVEGNFLLYSQANFIAEMLKSKLSQVATHIEIAGDLRRKAELIQEINFVVTTNDPNNCRLLFLNHGFVQKIIDKKACKVLLKQGISASLYIVDESKFPLVLLYSTGNEKHLLDLEKEASLKKISLISDSFTDESSIYQRLGLHFIPPELREGYGEIQAAKYNNFSNLIKETDLKGTFHCHTIESDGANTIEEMVQAALEMGWQYLGITDHSKSSHQANGLSEERLLAQNEWIRNFNKKLGPSFKVFSGLECDILKNGDLDFGPEVLKKLDFVIVSVHSQFKQEKAVMTNRIIKAIENPYMTMLGHLSGRLLRTRDPYQVDVQKVIDACIANDKIIELNAYPNRLDMDWRFWIQAQEKGLKCSINPDAHSLYDLHNCHYGVAIARKGWLKKETVINTLNLKEMIQFLKKRKK